MVKKTVYGLVIFMAIFLIVVAFLPKRYYVERSVQITESKQTVFEYVRILENQQNFAVWQAMDPNVVMKYTGKSGEVGSVYTWDSQMEDVGAGEQELISVDSLNRLEWQLRFKRPFEATDMAFMTTAEKDGITKVVWGFEGQMDYPSNILLLFMDFDQMLGPQLQTGLDNLKIILEEK